jgi:hypothetical protein
MAAGRAAATSRSCSPWRGLEDALDRVQVVSLLDRGFRGMAKPRECWHVPLGDRRTKDQLTQAQRAYNREQAGLRALVEQAIAHLGNAWVLRRWRGLLYRVREVFRAAGVLICLGPLAAPRPRMNERHVQLLVLLVTGAALTSSAGGRRIDPSSAFSPICRFPRRPGGGPTEIRRLVSVTRTGPSPHGG